MKSFRNYTQATILHHQSMGIYACESFDILSFIIQKLISNKNCPNSNPASCISRDEKKKCCKKKKIDKKYDCNLLKYDELLLISTNKKMNWEIRLVFFPHLVQICRIIGGKYFIPWALHSAYLLRWYVI